MNDCIKMIGYRGISHVTRVWFMVGLIICSLFKFVH